MCELYGTDDCDDCDDCNEDVENGFGDCFVVHGRHIAKYMFHTKCDNLLLVHGEVIGQGNLSGIPYGHCWLEDTNTNMVTDMSNNRTLTMDRDEYYLLGNVDVESGNKLFRYTAKQVREFIDITEHWGPWELDCER